MTTAAMQTPATQTPAMLPYKRQGEIDYASLEFNPDKRHTHPDDMEQNPQLHAIHDYMRDRFSDYDQRADVLLDSNVFICYDPANLNVRVAPDIILAFGVDAASIRRRRIYLPWEAGKAPDYVLEVASESTGRVDTGRKRRIYAEIGIQEYWRFDATGGRYHGAPMAGERLVNGGYERIDLTDGPDGILKGYSEVIRLSLCWDNGWPLFYDPGSGIYLQNRRQERAAHDAERAALMAENELLRERLRRLQSGS